MPAATTYRDAHPVYRKAGWIGPLPLADGTKWPPPEGWTGWHGAYPSYADSEAWCDCTDYRETHQIALRMADGVIGIDIDHYGDKRGADTIAEGERRWGPLPDGPRSSARGDGPAGIRFFRVPRGTVLRTALGFRELGIGSVEIIQRHHRYAVVWPSVHPTGSTYLWYGTDAPDGPPRVADLPALPAAWVEALASNGEPGEAEATPEQVQEFSRGHGGGDHSASLNGPVAIFRRDVAAGLARHDAMVNAACMAAREARAGAYPASEARRALREEFILALAEAKAGQRIATPVESRREFESVWGWAVGQALAMTVQECQARIRRNEPPLPPEPPEDEWTEPVLNMPADIPPPLDGEEEVNSWAPVDIDEILDGTRVTADASVGAGRTDGVLMLYPGHEHVAIGETEAGKSWFALLHCAAELHAGRRVIYVHFEETDAGGTVLRLIALGVPRYKLRRAAGLFDFIAPERRLNPADVALLHANSAPSLVILDGVNEAMTLHGHDIMKPDGAALYRKIVARPFKRGGATVLSLDHVVKDAAAKGNGYAAGSAHKINGLDGAAFLLENLEPFGEGQKGATAVSVVKDRPGKLRRHGVADKRVARKYRFAVMSIDATDESGTVSAVMYPAREQDKVGEDFDAEREARDRREFDQEVFEVVAKLEQTTDKTGPSPTAVIAASGRRATDVRAALERLRIAERLVMIEKGKGKHWRTKGIYPSQESESA